MNSSMFVLQSFRQNCTHVICGKLSRSEKFLGACSMGKWVLHPDYIKQSVKYKSWLQEELFEWSNYDEPNLPIDLKSAGSRWRFNYEVFQTFPFSGWNVAVVVSGAKKCSVYRRYKMILYFHLYLCLSIFKVSKFKKHFIRYSGIMLRFSTVAN